MTRNETRQALIEWDGVCRFSTNAATKLFVLFSKLMEKVLFDFENGCKWNDTLKCDCHVMRLSCDAIVMQNNTGIRFLSDKRNIQSSKRM